ncbi:MAG: hypothetical protein EBR86_09995 [Planctomycetia bacterium]|nr:hypothetical protein [Planctomycetia bacterium]
MVDLLIIYDVDGWAYHWQAQALARHAPDDFRVRLAAIDILPGTPHDHAATPDEANHWEHHFARRIQPAEYSAALDAVLGTKPPDLIFVMCHHQPRIARSMALPQRLSGR